MDANGEVCLGLGLGLVLSESSQPQKKNKRLPFLDLSIPIHPNDHGAEFNSNSNSNLKLIRQDHEKQASMSSFSKEDDFSRKKLRLTRDQTTMLQDSFRQHTTLSTAQKQTLAEKSNLKPRQVEVWFQNRRARTKLKQTEVECEILKKNCERLSDENRRLKKEVLELRSSMKIEKRQPTPFCHRNQTAACVKSGTCRGGGEKQEAAAAAVLEVVQEP